MRFYGIAGMENLLYTCLKEIGYADIDDIIRINLIL